MPDRAGLLAVARETGGGQGVERHALAATREVGLADARPGGRAPCSVRTWRSSPECDEAMIASSAGSRSNASIPPASMSATTPNGLTVERRVTIRSGSPSWRISVRRRRPRRCRRDGRSPRCRCAAGERGSAYRPVVVRPREAAVDARRARGAMSVTGAGTPGRARAGWRPARIPRRRPRYGFEIEMSPPTFENVRSSWYRIAWSWPPPTRPWPLSCHVPASGVPVIVDEQLQVGALDLLVGQGAGDRRRVDEVRLRDVDPVDVLALALLGDQVLHVADRLDGVERDARLRVTPSLEGRPLARSSLAQALSSTARIWIRHLAGARIVVIEVVGVRQREVVAIDVERPGGRELVDGERRPALERDVIGEIAGRDLLDERRDGGVLRLRHGAGGRSARRRRRSSWAGRSAAATDATGPLLQAAQQDARRARSGRVRGGVASGAGRARPPC